ncbi:MAG: glycosyltransferase, partial [Candidatus Omnitrophica bacterium]|nr:glycosyltransferase [Candidatus Omnitrophota bacterium]
MNQKVSIIIPNWNGLELLKKNFYSVYESVKLHNSENEIIIVDNGSNDKSIDFIKKNFPDVKVIKLKENKGFGYACNIGVKYCKNKIFILLNNDVKVDKNFISPLLKHF